MTLLAMDTSSPRGSVALLRDGALLLDESFVADRSHSTTLFTVLERVRELADTIDTIAVGLGPGSFAGIRIAISAAIGFQVALGCRLVGVPSDAALDTGVARFCAVGDARRETFYFTRVEDGRCLDGPRLVTADVLRALDVQFAELPFYTSVALPALPRAVVAVPCARRIAELAESGTSIVAEDALEPLYLREVHITWPKAAPR
jgi:tRNA threonylcarbamoyladenosine biosynthesis protein TsaB